MTGIRPTYGPDLDFLAENMRAEDISEIQGFSGLSPLDSLLHGFEHSRTCLTGVIDDEPICVFGVVTEYTGRRTPPRGLVWMHGTDRIRHCPYTFLRRCRRGVDRLWFDYDRLHNHTSSINFVHHDWLKWLGFTIDYDSHQTFNGPVPYLYFYKDRPHV